jgi:hypothetical protein
MSEISKNNFRNNIKPNRINIYNYPSCRSIIERRVLSYFLHILTITYIYTYFAVMKRYRQPRSYFAVKRYRQTTLSLAVVRRKKFTDEESQITPAKGVLSMNDDCIGVVMGYLGPGEIHRISKVHPIIERISLQDFIWKGVYKDVQYHNVGRKVYSAAATENLYEFYAKSYKATNDLNAFGIDIYTKNPSAFQSTFIINFVKANRISIGVEKSTLLARAISKARTAKRYTSESPESSEDAMWFANHLDRAMYIMSKRCAKCNKPFLNENGIKTCYDYGKSCYDDHCMRGLLCTLCSCNNVCNICGFYVVDDNGMIDPPYSYALCYECDTIVHMKCNGIGQDEWLEGSCNACKTIV